MYRIPETWAPGAREGLRVPIYRTPDMWAEAVRRNREIAALSDLDRACQITHGRYFWPLDAFHPGNDFDIEFIAMVLAGERRWGGILVDERGYPSDYSVAQHCVHVADVVNVNRAVLLPDVDWSQEEAPTFYGLMHDSSEAYLKDIPRPIKPALGDYYTVEKALMDRILMEFAVPVSDAIKRAVRIVDDMFIFLERDKLAGKPVVPYTNEATHPKITIDDVVPDFHVWDRKTAKNHFLDKFEQIVKLGGNYEPLNYAGRGFTL